MIIKYVPTFYRPPTRTVNAPTAWNGLELIIPAIIHEFDLDPSSALEFGVQHGFSTAALANYFAQVVGVDTFEGDVHAGIGDPDHTFNATKSTLNDFPNIRLVRMDYRNFIQHDSGRYNLIHVDIVHTYEDTYACGSWAMDHSDCVIFHDTESFPEVKQAVMRISSEHNMTFFNYPHCHGLGILREGR